MPCYKPLTGWRSDKENENGKFPVVFKHQKSSTGHHIDLPEIELPCGKCIGCRLEYSRQWALRIMHESTMHEQNTFITLTYEEEHLPSDQSLDKREWQLFLKKLRKELHPKKIRFFMCGEYGQDQELLQLGINSLGRPHYHAVIFGHEFPDKLPVHTNHQNDLIYTSPTLEKTWGKGFVTVGNVTFESAAYVARYVVKKVTGDQALDHYQYCDSETGETFLREPEFCLQSRRPGIARKWFDKYKTDLDKGFITQRGIRMQPPKYYDKLFEEFRPFRMDEIKELRSEQSRTDTDSSPERLVVKEKLKLKKLKTLKRNLK